MVMAALERPKPQRQQPATPKATPQAHNYLEAVPYLEEFLRWRHTPSERLRQLPRFDPDGAYPSGTTGSTTPNAQRYEMNGTFVPDALDRVANPSDRDDLDPYPDWCWTGWEAEIAKLPYLRQRAVRLMAVEGCSQVEVETRTNRGADTIREAYKTGLLWLATALLDRNLKRPLV